MPKVNRRDHAAVIGAFFARLPRGPVWPRHPRSWLYQVVAGITALVHRWIERAYAWAQFETFPPASRELFTDWERVLGLPDPCLGADATMAERRERVREKLAARPGAQTRAYFIALAERLGFQVRIIEHAPYMAGVARAGMNYAPGTEHTRWECGPHTLRAWWTMEIVGLGIVWHRCGLDGGQAGVDPHMRLMGADGLMCLIRRRKPAHTHVTFTTPS